VLGDAVQLSQVLFNVVRNAMESVEKVQTRSIRMDIRQENREILIEVHDTGPGIAAEHLPRLAERFYRVDRSRSRETGGTGLGLAITKHVMQRHGGELRIDSVVGQGSTFKLIFPQSRLVVDLD